MSPGVGLLSKDNRRGGSQEREDDAHERNSMQKHETADQVLDRQVQDEQEVADGPRLGRNFAFACIDLEINTINNGKLWEPVNIGQLWSHAFCLVLA